MEALTRLVEQTRSLWGNLRPVQRLLIAGTGSALFALLVYLALFASGSDYMALFTGLRPEDAGEVVASLREQGIPYRLAGDGGTVLVPKDRVYETRIDLASQGLPRGGLVGFEVLEKTNLGLTDFERRLRYLWALQNELTRTIREIVGVVDARVHVVLPERSLFVQDSRPSTASVLLQLEPGASLSRDQVRGIVNLLARSVEGLDPSNVTVVDTRGNVLSDGIGGDGSQGAAVSQQLAARREYEQYLERRLQAALEPVWGMGKVVARVSAELGFDVFQERKELFEPVSGREGIIRSEQRSEERSLGPSTAAAAGPPGVSSNVPGVPGYVFDDSSAGGQYERTDTLTNFEVNRTEQFRQAAPGRLERLSVAVWIDGDLSPADLERARQLVSSAVGLMPERGDTVSVESMRFEGPSLTPLAAQLAALQGEEQAAARVGVQRSTWIAAAIAALFLLGYALSRRRRTAAVERRAAVDVLVDAGTEEEAPLQREPISPEERRRREEREEVARLARESPEEFVRLLKSWMVEDQ